jgi:uncharacterized protein YraI
MTPAAQLRLWCGAALFTFCGSVLAQNAVITSPADVYAGPDDSYPPVAQLEPETPVQVNGCLDDWSWCDVSFEDNRGWVYAPDITYAYEGGYVPLYSYAPGLGIPVIAFSLNDYWDRYYHSRPWYGQREEWIRRGPPRHRRPAGPPPSANPPPRSVITQRPRMGDREDKALRLGSAEEPRRDNPDARRAAEAQRGAEQRRDERQRDDEHHEAAGGANPRIMQARPEQQPPQARPETHVPAAIPQHPAAAPPDGDRGARAEHAQPREPPRPEHEDQPR